MSDDKTQNGVKGRLKNLEAMGFVHVMPGMAPPPRRKPAAEDAPQPASEGAEPAAPAEAQAAAPLAHVQRPAGPRRAHKPTHAAGATPEGEPERTVAEGEAGEAERLRAEVAALEGRLLEAQKRSADLEARVAELDQQLNEQQKQRQQSAKLEARVAELEQQLKEQQQQQQQPQGGSCRLTCYAGTHIGDTICVAGSSAALGSWDPHKTPMRYVAFEGSRGMHAWEVVVAAAPAEFKFVWLGPGGGVQWEAGPNRQLGAGQHELSDSFRFW